MKEGWRTHVIGRHLVDLPGDAKLVERWKYNQDPLEPIPIKSEAHFKQIVAQRETELRTARHQTNGPMLIERVNHAQGSVTLVSWEAPTSKIMYHFDTYFCAGTKVIKNYGVLSPKFKQQVLADFDVMSREWREIKTGEIPEGVGYVAGEMILVDKDYNPESWTLSIQLAGKPDVDFHMSAYVVGKPDVSLRERAGGIVAGMLGMAAGLSRLRNRERPIGPIWAEEILVAGTQNGKRGYGFKWEAPGKARSLAEPNLNIALEVGESAYKTNAQSFANDDEALEIWDAVVDSIRLRPGAV